MFYFGWMRHNRRNRDNEQKSIQKINNNDIYEFIDPDTGVHYWIYSHYNEGGMTPRLNSDGTVMVTSIK